MFPRVATLSTFLLLIFPLLTSASVIAVRGESWQGDGSSANGGGGSGGGGGGGGGRGSGGGGGRGGSGGGGGGRGGGGGGRGGGGGGRGGSGGGGGNGGGNGGGDVDTDVATNAGSNGGGFGGGSTTFEQCNTGKLQCCNSVQSASSSAVQKALGLISVPIGPITGQVGLTCNPISVIGVGGNSCSAQPACCTGNSFGGGGLLGSLVVVGCSPIHANL